MQQGTKKEALHRNGQIKQKCAINGGIQQNGSKKPFIKSKNLFALKSILKCIQRFARYKILALISIGTYSFRDPESSCLNISSVVAKNKTFVTLL